MLYIWNGLEHQFWRSSIKSSQTSKQISLQGLSSSPYYLSQASLSPAQLQWHKAVHRKMNYASSEQVLVRAISQQALPWANWAYLQYHKEANLLLSSLLRPGPKFTHWASSACPIKIVAPGSHALAWKACTPELRSLCKTMEHNGTMNRGQID